MLLEGMSSHHGDLALVAMLGRQECRPWKSGVSGKEGERDRKAN